MFKKVSSELNFADREKRIAEFWKANNIFEKSLEMSRTGTPFIFYDGPPTANGKPHIGHVLTRVIKDLIPRYRTMKGHYVPRKAGWDTHGLPVELEVEKLLGINGKDQIESYGLEPFIAKCKESVWKYKGMWEDFSQTVGFWADMDHPYVTYHNDFIESEWWALKQIWEKGLLYKGFKIVPYCPRCGTPLSSHEVAQGYKNVKEKTAFVKFKVKDEDAYFLVWTTTPWTLPSNVALCVNPDEDYIKLQVKDDAYYMAEALASTLFDGGYQVLATCKGKALEYKEYEPLYDFYTSDKRDRYVTCDSYVTLTEGTGIVHIAPAFGEDDARVGRNYDLPFVQLVDSKGQMTSETAWPGVFCKDADELILNDLISRNLLFASPKHEHSYPFCWRCDTPLIYYARESWFIKMTAVKENLIRNNNTVHWIPESIGKGRFGDWLENVQDWGISRNRYWGTPLNIWECSCGHRHSIGSIEELKTMSKTCPEDIELHRPFVDAITITCDKCGGEMTRVPEVIDCWFDSGAMPFAQHHYPFENKELFQEQFPADFISEAVDQTRGWFYSLLAISTLLFDKAPFKNVIVLGHVQDENGQKMSKSKGNAVDPFDALRDYGADAIRWYFYSNSAPWLPNRFYAKAVTEGQRGLLATLWNTYVFFVLYANIDEFDPTKFSLDKSMLSLMDQWLLSKLNSLIQDFDSDMENYRIPEASRKLEDFIDMLSNWYVRTSRDRYWVEGMPEDKVCAYMTLYTALVTVSKLAAPMLPFMCDDIYRNLVCSVDKAVPESVHFCAYPVADPSYINTKIESDMQAVMQAVSLGRTARNAVNIKNRQPLNNLYLMVSVDLSLNYLDIIKKELNIKTVHLLDDTSEFTSYLFKPQLRILGQKYGKKINDIRSALLALDGNQAKKNLDVNGYISLTLTDSIILLTAEELLIETKQKEGFESYSDGKITVVLDTELTETLIEEGFVREIISKIQHMRKDAGLNVIDHIVVTQAGSRRVSEILMNNRDFIAQEVLADDIITGKTEGFIMDWDVNGEPTTFGVK